MKVSLRYFAAAGAAVGTNSETLEIADGATVKELAELIRTAHSDDADQARLEKVLSLSSFLVNGKTADEADEVPADASVDVLPPFAGGGR